MPARLYLFELSHPSQAVRLALDPRVAPLIAARPCGEHALRVQPDAPGPVPMRLPEAWLPA